MNRRFLLFVLLSVLLPLSQKAGAQTDSLSAVLRETTVTAARRTGVAVPSSGKVSVKLDRITGLPMLLGTADPLTYARYLPAMAAQSELDAGIHVQGNDHPHSVVSSGGVPIYGANHLLGLFSVFNPAHFGRMDFSTRALEKNRLGGSVDMPLPDSLQRRFNGEYSVGLMAAQATFRVPVGLRASVTASARRSFLNLLYSSFLSLNHFDFRYAYSDYNLTAQWYPGRQDRLWLDFYYGADAVDVLANASDMSADSGWNNLLAALHWEHRAGEGALRQSLYYTAFGLDLDAHWTGIEGTMPSYLRSLGYKARWEAGPWLVALESIGHRALPQSPDVSLGFNAEMAAAAVEKGWENTLLGRFKHLLGPVEVDWGLKGTLYRSPCSSWLRSLDPDVALRLNLYRLGRWEAGALWQHQYLFQTGLTSFSLPSEFWILAGEQRAPQSAFYTHLSYGLDFGPGAGWTFQADAYYKLLYNQLEYKGSVLDFLNAEYDVDNLLLHGNGRAFGVNLQLHKTSGALTGWVSYALGRSLRSFDHPSYPGEYPASFERIHELNAVLSWNLEKWTLGATLVAASGTPYTAHEQLFLMGHQVIALYGPHNGSRLAPYFRLDLSASYYFRRGTQKEHGLNFSLYNATGYENQLAYQLYMTEEGFFYGPMTFQIRFMPSVGYFHKF